MHNFTLDHKAPIRLGFFFGILLFMALWEFISSRRELTTAKGARWFANLGLVAIDTLAIRLSIPLQTAGMALFAANHGWGIMNDPAASCRVSKPKGCSSHVASCGELSS